jgi:hypothetical protein
MRVEELDGEMRHDDAGVHRENEVEHVIDELRAD